MPQQLERVSETELEILKVLWERSEATIRELTEALYRESSDSQYATVQKLLDRLEAKSYVVRDRGSRAHRFRPRVSREAFLGGRLRELADKLCGGSLAPLVSNLLDSRGLSAADRADLRRYLEQLELERDPHDEGEPKGG